MMYFHSRQEKSRFFAHQSPSKLSFQLIAKLDLRFPGKSMPAPGNTTEFLSVVEKSGLLEEDDLDRYRFRSAADPSPPDRVAKWMIMDGCLTPFQVEQLLAGKSRPFFVGPYKVLTRVGNGSMGVVYLCEHRTMRRKVAVKFLQKRRVQDAEAMERFLREARAAAAVNHPNVVRALDFGCEKQLHYLVMEYIDGRSLKARVHDEGPLSPLKVADYLRQAALGLQHAHDAGMILRDIKPSNIMIDRAGVIKLLDLGLARFEDGAVDLTRGRPLGTMAFVAPEQALDSHTVDARADIYSLGATFYLVLTGRTPKPGIRISDSLPPVIDDFDNFNRVMAVLRRMTAFTPKDRYQRAAEVAAEMELLLKPQEPEESSTPDEPLTPSFESEELLTPSFEIEEPVTLEEPLTPEFEPAEPVATYSNELNPGEQTVAEFDTIETVESTALVENALESPSVSDLRIEEPPPETAFHDLESTPSSNLESTPSSQVESTPSSRLESTPRIQKVNAPRDASPMEGRRVQKNPILRRLSRNWQLLVLGLAVVLGLVAALVTK
jgi:serine/threonine protein kinase